MRIIKILLLVLVVGGLAVYGFIIYRQSAEVAAAATKEKSAQTAEISQCKERLKQFYQAVQNFKKDHKGGMPTRVEELTPKYIKPELMACPTAERLAKEGKGVGQGNVSVAGKSYPVTYGFKWLTAAYARWLKREGERTPLIGCQTHQEAMYLAVFHKLPPLGVFGGDERAKLPSEIRNVHTLVVRSNGKVEELAEAAEE
jgi:hypothetical protein